MPELPDIAAYVRALETRIMGEPIANIRVANPFLLRTAVPPLTEIVGRRVVRLSTLGKRIAFHTDDARVLVLHLMIAGRLKWLAPGAPIPKRLGLFALDFSSGSLVLTEAGTKRRASLHYFSSAADAESLDRGGIDPLTASRADFAEALRCENHTLKRSLTDPRLFSGIGNAYSDEIFFEARISPLKQTSKLSNQEVSTLHDATVKVLRHWVDELSRGVDQLFPEKVTAFRDGMTVHGRFGKPCVRCGTPIQRIVRGEHETCYCPECQTQGSLLRDRALSRLLGKDWPKTVAEMEEMKAVRRKAGAS